MKRHGLCKFTIEEEKQIIEMYQKEKSAVEVAKVFNCCPPTITSIIKAYGLYVFSSSEARKWKNRDVEKRFWSYMDIKEDDECWNWQRGKSKTGYGQFHYHGRHMKASRVAYIIYYGSIPEGMCVCHTCDNPSCCNPNHLFLGTHKENMEDKAKKGRCHSKITENDVRNIRFLSLYGFSQRAIGSIFNVDQARVSRIVNRHIWSNVI